MCGVGIVAYSVSDLATRPISYEWLILLALTVASGLATLRIPGMPISFSISDIFSIAAALVFGPAAGAVTAALDGLVLSARMATSQRSLHRVAVQRVGSRDCHVDGLAGVCRRWPAPTPRSTDR